MPDTHHNALPLASSAQGEGENNMENPFMDQDKGGVTEQKLCGCVQKKKTKDLFSTPHQHMMSSHFSESVASVHIGIAPGDKCNDNQPPFSSSFLFAFIAEQMSYDIEYPFSQFWSAFPAMSPPKTLTFPSLLVRGEVGETALMRCQHCSAAARTLAVLSTPF